MFRFANICTTVDFRLGYGKSFVKDCKLLVINQDSNLLKLNKDKYNPTLLLHNNPGNVLLKLVEYIKSRNVDDGATIGKPKFKYEPDILKWNEYLKEYDESFKDNLKNKAKEFNKANKTTRARTKNKCVHPIDIMYAINKVKSDNSTVITDGGICAYLSNQILDFTKPLQMINSFPRGPGHVATLGAGAGFGVGSAVNINTTGLNDGDCNYKDNNEDNKQLWLIWGDGGCGYSIMELETMSRNNISCICVIINDSNWSQISNVGNNWLNDQTGCDLIKCDYHLIADALNGKGYYVDNKSNLIKTLQRAKNWSLKHNKPVVVNVISQRTDQL